MKITLSPESELRYASESFSDALSQGMTQASDFASRLKDNFPAILRGFKPSQEVVTELPELAGLSDEQKAFALAAKTIPYTDMREFIVVVPAGLKVSYLEYIEILLEATESLKTIQGQVLEPYLMTLGKIVSDPKGNVTTDNRKGAYSSLEKNREALAKALASCFSRNANEERVAVKHLIQRNGDWAEVLKGVNQLNENMLQVDRKALAGQVAQANDLLGLVYGMLKEGKLEGTSLEAAQSLSEGAYQVACELQFFSATYYRVLSLTGTLEAALAELRKPFGV